MLSKTLGKLALVRGVGCDFTIDTKKKLKIKIHKNKNLSFIIKKLKVKNKKLK